MICTNTCMCATYFVLLVHVCGYVHIHRIQLFHSLYSTNLYKVFTPGRGMWERQVLSIHVGHLDYYKGMGDTKSWWFSLRWVWLHQLDSTVLPSLQKMEQFYKLFPKEGSSIQSFSPSLALLLSSHPLWSLSFFNTSREWAADPLSFLSPLSCSFFFY